jgi:hypothetical protein
VNVRTLFLVGALALGARDLAAQAAVLQADPVLPPEKKVVEVAIYQLRDTLNLVEAAGARFARDRQQVSDAALRSRARVIAERCRASVSISDSTQGTIKRQAQPTPDPRGLLKRIDKSIVDVRAKLLWCDKEFTRLSEPANAEELRGYGIGRAQQVSDLIQAYMRNALGARYVPITRGAGSSAAGSPR